MFQYDPLQDDETKKMETFTRPAQRPPSPTTERTGRPPSLLGVASGMGAAFQGRPMQPAPGGLVDRMRPPTGGIRPPQQPPRDQDPMQPGGPIAASAAPALGAFMRQAQPVARGGPLPYVQPTGRPFNPRDIVGTAPQPVPKPQPPDPSVKWDPATNPGPGSPAFQGRPPQPSPPQMEPPEMPPAPGQVSPDGPPQGDPQDTAPGWRRRAFLDRLRSADESTPSPFPMTKFQRRRMGGTGGPGGPPPATY